MSYRLSVDVGGTFTDVVLFDNIKNEIFTTKVSSTSKDQSIGLIDGIKKIAKKNNINSYEEIVYFIHGTTVATNALLERKGAKTALITTSGFRDVFEIGRQRRPHLYDFWAKRPKPPIPRYLIFEVPERVLYDGKIEIELDEERLKDIIRKIIDFNVESVAICFLHSYKNPTNELRAKEIILKELPKIYISTSYETLPEIREYERICTTSVNAYLMPRVQKYINNLNEKKSALGIKSNLHIMQSNGGRMSADVAARRSVHTVFSGPAGGVLACIYISKLISEPNLITLDMGGTSTDIALLEGSNIKLTTNGEIGSFPIKVPMIEMNTIGTGGGSIGWVDTGGALRVGPESAGADPGPACYGLGNGKPTITDANLVLGRLNPENFLGGEKQIYIKSSMNAIKKNIDSKIHLSTIESANGIIDVANSNMIGGIKVISTQKGYDLREFSLITFGGAGPMHASALAKSLGMKKIIIPLYPGHFSALGCMLAEIRYDYVRTIVKELSEISIQDYHKAYSEMKKEAIVHLNNEGYLEKDIVFNGTADVRYFGQAWELTITVPVKLSSKKDIKNIRENFERMHKTTYGYALEDEEVLLINLRLTAIGITQKMELLPERLTKNKKPITDAIKYSKKIFYNRNSIDCLIYDRNRLLPGNEFEGPAVIEEYASSTFVPPGSHINIDKYRNIIIGNKEM